MLGSFISVGYGLGFVSCWSPSKALLKPQAASLTDLMCSSRSTASPNAHITEGPSLKLVGKDNEKRDFNPCTQWTLLGGKYKLPLRRKVLIFSGGEVGCSGTETCLFATVSGYNWEFCGDISNPQIIATYCYNYPTIWNGISPQSILYWSVLPIIKSVPQILESTRQLNIKLTFW